MLCEKQCETKTLHPPDQFVISTDALVVCKNKEDDTVNI